MCVWGGNVASILFVLDKTPYWFVRTYIILFLMAPILNMYLDRIMFKERFILLCILFFIAVYLGIRSDDTSLVGGKNIVNFMFIYSIGDTLMVFKERVNNVRTYKYVISWILLNVLVMLGYQFTGCNPLWVASFSYCGPILILNATLLFCIFSKISIKSSTINAMGTSMFSVYILHCDPTVLKCIVLPLVQQLHNYTLNNFSYLFGLVLLTCGIFASCILMDKLFTPLWILGRNIAGKVDLYIQRL